MKLIGVICGTVGIGCLVVVCGYLVGLNRIQQNTTHTALFKKDMCYIGNDLREPWQTNPDGIIVMTGYQKYLVLPAHEADRVSGGVKIGAEEEIIAFDSKYHQYLCPETWLTHKHTPDLYHLPQNTLKYEHSCPRTSVFV